jgi:hypothetical protein
LPDGLFSNQQPNFGYILEGLAMEDVGTFCVPIYTTRQMDMSVVRHNPQEIRINPIFYVLCRTTSYVVRHNFH